MKIISTSAERTVSFSPDLLAEKLSHLYLLKDLVRLIKMEPFGSVYLFSVECFVCCPFRVAPSTSAFSSQAGCKVCLGGEDLIKTFSPQILETGPDFAVSAKLRF